MDTHIPAMKSIAMTQSITTRTGSVKNVQMRRHLALHYTKEAPVLVLVYQGGEQERSADWKQYVFHSVLYSKPA